VAKRPYLPREQQLLTEWLAIHHQGDLTMTRFRLGVLEDPPPGSSNYAQRQAMLTRWRRWADAVVVEADRLLVVEAKIIPDVGVIAQLQLYLKLVPKTPELTPYLNRQIVGVLVTAADNPELNAMAAEAGFEAHIYHPAWVDDYLQTLSARQGRTPTLT